MRETWAQLDSQHGNRRAGRGRERDSVNGGGAAGERIHQAAERGAQDRGGLENAGAPGEGALEMLLGHELRQDGAAGRGVEGARDSDDHHDGVDGIDGMDAAQGDDQQQRGAQAVAQ